jgi:hypothetical protein
MSPTVSSTDYTLAKHIDVLACFRKKCEDVSSQQSIYRKITVVSTCPRPSRSLLEKGFRFQDFRETVSRPKTCPHPGNCVRESGCGRHLMRETMKAASRSATSLALSNDIPNTSYLISYSRKPSGRASMTPMREPLQTPQTKATQRALSGFLTPKPTITSPHWTGAPLFSYTCRGNVRITKGGRARRLNGTYLCICPQVQRKAWDCVHRFPSRGG